MKKISLIVYDFDGVLTDNRVLVNERGEEAVYCNRSDGWWIGAIRDLGVAQMILSTEPNPVVAARAKKLKIEALQGISDKRSALTELAAERSVALEEVVFVGNEMNDYACLQVVGHPFCPLDAHPKVKEVAQVLECNGGWGIVRHLHDWLVQ